jgi:hypothetical protein
MTTLCLSVRASAISSPKALGDFGLDLVWDLRNKCSRFNPVHIDPLYRFHPKLKSNFIGLIAHTNTAVNNECEKELLQFNISIAG